MKGGMMMEKICSKCGLVMTVKSGPHGQFLGCAGYPNCRNTEQVVEQAKEFEHAQEMTAKGAEKVFPERKPSIFLSAKSEEIARATIFNAAIQVITSSAFNHNEGDISENMVHVIDELTSAYNYTNESVKAL